jgi:hypothetical protein
MRIAQGHHNQHDKREPSLPKAPASYHHAKTRTTGKDFELCSSQPKIAN